MSIRQSLKLVHGVVRQKIVPRNRLIVDLGHMNIIKDYSKRVSI